jgi:hypothetical protein
MAKSELHFLGHTIDLLTIETDYNKPFHKSKGFPYFYNEGGLLKVTFGFGENHRFLERMTTVNYDLYKKGYPLDDGKVMFYDANGDFLKRWSFQDAAIVFYKVVFDTNGGGMIVEMIISPAIQNYGEKLHRWWHISPIPEEEEYKSPVLSEEPVVKEEKEESEMFPVWTHYQMTYEALIKAGIEEEEANEIAHYASTYADNPNGIFMVMNMGLALNFLYDPKRLSYDRTKYGTYDKEYSQIDDLVKAVSIHGMRAYWEDITPQEAIKRALYGGVYEEKFTKDGKKVENCKMIRIIGAYEVIEQLKGRDINNLSREDKKLLGTAFHTIQDAVIHRGGRWVDNSEEKAAMLGNKSEHPDLYEVGTAIGISPKGEFKIAIQKTEEAIKMIHKK